MPDQHCCALLYICFYRPVMNLQETIHSITAQFGESVLDEPLRLLGLLEDLGGFKDLDPSRRKVLREQIRSGGVRQLLKPRKTEVRRYVKPEPKEIRSPEPAPLVVDQSHEDEFTPKEWERILKAMNAPCKESVVKRIRKWFSSVRKPAGQTAPKASKVVKPKPKKIKVKIVPASSPNHKPAKPIRQKRQPRKLTDDQKTNIAIMIWCMLMLACLVTGVTGFWKLFAGTISHGGACWMIFPSIIVGGILWLFNEAF